MKNYSNEEYDVIVIGSGPGGAAVAKELTEIGKRVMIIEWGPGKKVRGTFRQFLREQCWPGRGLLFTNKLLGLVRGITTGGSSLFYYGTCFPVPHDMLKKYDIDVSNEEKEVRKEIPIGPLKNEMITPMTRRIMESAREIGYDWKKLDKFMYQEKWKPGMKFGYYGDPHGVKWSSRMYVMEAVQKGAVLLNRAKVTNIIVEDGNATGVEFRMKGKRYKAFAKQIIVSAGGIGSPVLLRRIGIKEAGTNFFFDPLITVCGRVNDLKKRTDEIPMSAGCHFPEDNIVMTDMPIPTILDKIFSAQVFRFHRLFETRKTLRIMVKIRDDLGGRLTDSGGVRKKLSSKDARRLMKGYAIAKDILKKAGAKGIYKTWYLAAHPGGTVKIGELVDSNLKSIHYENLYVCDCSVIPEAWGFPPTLTLLCLGKRLARHLASGNNREKGRKTKVAVA